MSIIESKDICEINTITDDDTDFKDYLAPNPSGFKVVAREYPDCEGLVLYSDAGDFIKWFRKNNPEINIEVQKPHKKLVLHSGDYWIPLVFLASDMTIPIYLGIVANYLYDKMKGALKGEKPRVHLSAMYEDNSDGITKKFEFEGDIDSLQKAIIKFNLNRFLDD